MTKEQNDKELIDFMKNVAYLRKTYGLSKREMAKTLNIGIESLNKIERGDMPERLSMNVVFSIEDHFKIPARELFKSLSN